MAFDSSFNIELAFTFILEIPLDSNKSVLVYGCSVFVLGKNIIDVKC